MARSNRSILNRFFNLPGSLKDSPAALSLSAVALFYFSAKAVFAGELNMSRSSLSPSMLHYAEHPAIFILVMLGSLVLIGCLLWRAYLCWIDSDEE